MRHLTMPKLSVFITDYELKLLVKDAITNIIELNGFFEGGIGENWQSIFEEQQDDPYIVLLERLRVVYNIEV